MKTPDTPPQNMPDKTRAFLFSLYAHANIEPPLHLWPKATRERMDVTRGDR
jgi:hypothetical protein